LSTLGFFSLRKSAIARFLLLGAAYVAGTALGQFLKFPQEEYWPFWPPNGLFLGALLVSPRKDWPLLWGATLPAALISNLLFEGFRADLIPLALAFWLANTLEALLAAWLLRRYVAERLSLSNMREFLAIIAIGGILTPALGATLGAIAAVTLEDAPSFAESWLQWWIGDAVGVLLVAPVVITWSGASASPRIRRHPWAYSLEFGVHCLALLAVMENVFHQFHETNPPLTRFPFFLLTPLMLWAGMRFEPRAAAISLLLLGSIVTWCTTRGYGPIAQYDGGVVQQELLLQGLLVQISCLTLLFSSSIERRVLTEARLQQALSEIKTLRGLIPICAHCKKIRNDEGAWERLESYMMSRTEAEFTHGVCPDCFSTMFGEQMPDSIKG
jgi:integral membrane sensor domain MASE1